MIKFILKSIPQLKNFFIFISGLLSETQYLIAYTKTMQIHEVESRIDIKFETLIKGMWDAVYRSVEYCEIFTISQTITNPLISSVSHSVLTALRVHTQLNYDFEWRRP